MNKLLVTGVSGFLGPHICRAALESWSVYGTVCANNAEIAGVNIARIDLTNYAELKKLFADVGPDAVVHAAAISQANICQNERSISGKTNVDASINIAKLCADLAIPCVFTSTDLVFDGENAPYNENSPVNPINIYGEQKAMAEAGMAAACPDLAICRLALMFGKGTPASGSFLQHMIKAAQNGDELGLFVDEFRTPVNVNIAVKGILLSLEKPNGIAHLGGLDRISRYDFGKLLMKTMGRDSSNIKPLRLNESKMPAPRPRDVSFDISKAMSMGIKPLPIAEELESVIKPWKTVIGS